MPRPEIALRRNGRQQACEPCRRLKLRCDHGAPHCGRCTRRKMTEKCIYHPAPMTKPRSSDASAQLTPEKTPGIKTPVSTLSVSESVAPSSSWDPEPEMLDVDLPATADQGTLFRRAHTDYGTTSFSAPFSDVRTTIGPELLDFTAEDELAMNTNFALFNNAASKEENKTRMRGGIQAIRYFPSREVCQKLLSAVAIHEFVLSNTMVGAAIERIWSLYEKDFETPRSCAKMSKVVLDLCQTGKTPMPSEPAEGQSLLDWFLGPRLRWEMLGTVFAFFGMALISLQEWDPIFSLPEMHGLNRKTAAWRLKLAADGCLQFCHDTDTLNDVVVLLMMNGATLHSVCSGDESYNVSRRFAQVIDACVTMGLHRLGAEDDTPLQQWRRALFASADFNDKGHSSFNARPPMLTRLYCRKRAFFDISDEILYSTPARLKEARSRLDSNGWNVDGEVHDLTWAKALYSFTPVREEILMLSLGVEVHFPRERIDELLDHLDSAMGNWPPQLRYSEAMVNSSTGLVLFRLLRNRAEYLQNKFLLERLRVARCQGSGQGLLNVSQCMMKNVLNFWLKRDQLSIFNAYFDWMAVCYGIPAAGVLCVELLKTTRSASTASAQSTSQSLSVTSTPSSLAASNTTSPFTSASVPTASSTHTGTRPSQQPALQFSRSSVIQDLTMFIGFLDWIRPTDGNYLLCSKLRKVIRRIVDHVLDPPLPSDSGPVGSSQLTNSSDGIPSSSNNNGAYGFGSSASAGGFAGWAGGISFGGGIGAMGGGGIVVDPALGGDSMMGMDGIGAGDMGEMWMPPLDESDCLDWLGTVDWTTQGNWMDGLGN